MLIFCIRWQPKESDDLKEKQIDLPGACKAWIEAQKAGGEMVIQRHNHMMNIEHAIPITPHSQGSENITDTQKTVNLPVIRWSRP